MKLLLYVLLLFPLLFFSCPSEIYKETYINDYAYNLYNSVNAPPGSIIIDGLTGYDPEKTMLDVPLEKLNHPILSSFKKLNPEYFRDVNFDIIRKAEPRPTIGESYKQIGKIKNGRVKIVLLSDVEISGSGAFNSAVIFPTSIAKIRYVTLDFLFFSMYQNFEHIRFYYFLNDIDELFTIDDNMSKGDKILNPIYNVLIPGKEYHIKKGWAVPLEGELIQDDYNLTHLSEILEEKGVKWYSTYHPDFDHTYKIVDRKP